jgi:tetratricopeptide (TPR) repeat protein
MDITMMRLGRWLAALALCALHGYILHSQIYQPYRCNIVRKQIIARSERAQMRSQTTATILARTNIEILRPCLDVCRTSVDYYMLLAANLAMLGRTLEAEQMYRQALRYDRRPELYFELGQLLLVRGRRDEARQVFRMAGYSGSYLNEIGEETMRNEMVNELSLRDAKLRARIRK